MTSLLNALRSNWSDTISRRAYICAILSLIFFKIWLVGAYALYIHYSPHDGGLFIRLALFILNGEWLGPYDFRTLIKGPVYPLFIAGTYLLRIPMLFAQHLLYCLAALLFVHVVGAILKNRFLQLLAFALILFNPFSCDYPLFYIPYRMGLYVPLVIIFFATLIETSFPRKISFFHSITWSFSLGLAFTLLWYTREESIWVMPALVFSFACYLLPLREERLGLPSRLFVVALPVLIWGIGTLTLLQINNSHYGVRQVIDIKSDSFSSAYGGLLHINNNNPKPGIIVTKQMKQQAYAVSPTLKKLYPYLDGDKKRNWQNSFFMWSLRRGAQMGGFIQSAPEADEFWGQIGQELQTACDNKTLDCVRSKPSIRPIWHQGFNKIAPGEFWGILRTMTEFDDANFEDAKYLSNGTEEMMWNYIYVTGENYRPSVRRLISTQPKFHKEMKARHIYILKKISRIYENTVPVLFWLSVIGLIYLLYLNVRRRCQSYTLIPLLTLTGSIFVLTIMLTFVKITVWEISRPLHSGYPLILLFICYTGAALYKERENILE